MTSATERLRALLDERGARWTACSKAIIDNQTFCYGHTYTEFQAGLMVSDLTPEQAIAATLGPGTCHAVFEVDAMSGDERIGEFVCSECGETFNDGHGEFPHYCPGCGRKVVC